MLLALKEDSPPYALDPNTLETLGLYTFGGRLKSRTFSAHPKFDPDCNVLTYDIIRNPTDADGCRRMPTDADGCRRMPTDADGLSTDCRGDVDGLPADC